MSNIAISDLYRSMTNDMDFRKNGTSEYNLYASHCDTKFLCMIEDAQYFNILQDILRSFGYLNLKQCSGASLLSADIVFFFLARHPVTGSLLFSQTDLSYSFQFLENNKQQFLFLPPLRFINQDIESKRYFWAQMSENILHSM
ncbi:MAG: hypothetical protein VX112_00075 [Pseudomonadota bacterium]|nr:hypothetical protein [Pseudomonadota bacterium]